jgi:hypothetical protein
LAAEGNDDAQLLLSVADEFASIDLNLNDENLAAFSKHMPDDIRRTRVMEILDQAEKIAPEETNRALDFYRQLSVTYAKIGVEEKAFQFMAKAVDNAEDCIDIANCFEHFIEYSKFETKEMFHKLYVYGLDVAKKLGDVSELDELTFYDEDKGDLVTFKEYLED